MMPSACPPSVMRATITRGKTSIPGTPNYFLRNPGMRQSPSLFSSPRAPNPAASKISVAFPPAEVFHDHALGARETFGLRRNLAQFPSRRPRSGRSKSRFLASSPCDRPLGGNAERLLQELTNTPAWRLPRSPVNVLILHLEVASCSAPRDGIDRFRSWCVHLVEAKGLLLSLPQRHPQGWSAVVVLLLV